MPNSLFKNSLFLFLILVFNFYSLSQASEYVVRFNHTLLNYDVINDENQTKGVLSSFLNEKGRKIADSLSKKGVNFNTLQVEKMFYNWKTYDTVSISRQGNKVYIPPFWATFQVKPSKEMSGKQFFTTVQNSNPLVVYIDPPLKVELMNVPNDTLFHYQQSLLDTSSFEGGINVVSAWDIETGKRHIKVGVFDTGIDSSHQDIDVLTGEHYLQMFSSPFEPMSARKDVIGHGTPVAGIIGAKRNNTTGIAGIAGGDGSDSTGVSILDFKVLGYEGYEGAFSDPNKISVGIINSSRSVGTYYNWQSVMGGVYVDDDGNEYPHFVENMPGYGVHINNHSYAVRVADATHEEGAGPKDLAGDTTTFDLNGINQECHLCMEAYLFSLQNGVINVVSRGNGKNYNDNPYDIEKKSIPQRFDDSWVINVGASGTNGRRLYDTGNTGPVSNAPSEGWYSPLGRNIDLIAPGSLSNVATLRSSTMLPIHSDKYMRFNGTSASAPHVAGVAALMLSYYNKPCYSNQNLDPADVEYILQKSAIDLSPVGYDDSSGWGRLDALKALQMIEYPKYQIIHPQSPPIQIDLIEHDTIHIYLKDPIYADKEGPIGSNFVSDIDKIYKVEKRKYQLTYNFSEYLVPPLSSSEAQLLDVWLRHSQTNSLRELQDTIDSPYSIDTFQIEPDAQIVQLDPINGIITLEGYYYNFLGFYLNHFDYTNEILTSITSVWYPINPNNQTPQMAYSLYLYDSLAVGIDFPCDSANVLVDDQASLYKIEQENTLIIYPNPGKSQLTIQSQTGQHIEKVMLLDLSGRIVTEESLSKKSTVRIDTHALETGSYIVTVYLDNGKILTKKWLKL